MCIVCLLICISESERYDVIGFKLWGLYIETLVSPILIDIQPPLV